MDGGRADGIMKGYRVVLCRAEGSVNVGSCCRAMKAMGVTGLVLADCPVHDPVTVRTHALSAFDLFESAVRTPTLAGALEGFPLAVGFSRRTGRKRKSTVPVQRLAAELVGRDRLGVALVFGNERDGLSEEELDLCDLASSIPCSGLFPSLNLSHAVQLACWELRRAALGAGGPRDGGEDGVPAGREAYARAAALIADGLQDAGFYKIAGRAESERFLREVAARAALTREELERFAALFTKLSALDRHRRGDYS